MTGLYLVQKINNSLFAVGIKQGHGVKVRVSRHQKGSTFARMVLENVFSFKNNESDKTVITISNKGEGPNNRDTSFLEPNKAFYLIPQAIPIRQATSEIVKSFRSTPTVYSFRGRLAH